MKNKKGTIYVASVNKSMPRLMQSFIFRRLIVPVSHSTNDVMQMLKGGSVIVPFNNENNISNIFSQTTIEQKKHKPGFFIKTGNDRGILIPA